MDKIFFKRRFILLVILLIAQPILTNNNNNERLENKITYNYEDNPNFYKNYLSNLKNQQDILEKINSLVLKKKEEIGDILNKLSHLESEKTNKTTNSNLNNSSNNNPQLNIKQNNEEIFSSYCNNKKECLNIIDVEDYFLMNMGHQKLSDPLSKGNYKNSIIQNDVFKVRGIFDILKKNYNTDYFDDDKPEYIVDFLVMDFKDLITKNPTVFSDLVFKRNSPFIMNQLIFIIVLTNKSLNIFDFKYNLIENLNLNLESNIIKSDFSYLKEDNSILIFTQSFNLFSITLEFDLLSIANKLNIIENFNNKGETLKVKFLNLIFTFID